MHSALSEFCPALFRQMHSALSESCPAVFRQHVTSEREFRAGRRQSGSKVVKHCMEVLQELCSECITLDGRELRVQL